MVKKKIAPHSMSPQAMDTLQKCLKFWVLLFLALWFTLATLSNIFDLLKAHDLVPYRWVFVSGNLALVKDAIAKFNFENTASYFLFIVNILFLIIIAAAFYFATFLLIIGKECRFLTKLSFSLAIFFWSVYILLDELFLTYSLERGHIILLVMTILLFYFYQRPFLADTNK